jgi:hypothetical protein
MLDNIFEDIISMSLKTVCENLNTIGKIKPNDKMYHNEQYILIENSYIPFIKRKFRGSSRTDTINFIKYILTQSYFQLELLKKRSDPESIYLHMNLLNGLKYAIDGLGNLQITYSTDTNITYEIQKYKNYINKFFA